MSSLPRYHFDEVKGHLLELRSIYAFHLDALDALRVDALDALREGCLDTLQQTIAHSFEDCFAAILVRASIFPAFSAPVESSSSS
jgi:hypothetical protein